MKCIPIALFLAFYFSNITLDAQTLGIYGGGNVNVTLKTEHEPGYLFGWELTYPLVTNFELSIGSAYSNMRFEDHSGPNRFWTIDQQASILEVIELYTDLRYTIKSKNNPKLLSLIAGYSKEAYSRERRKFADGSGDEFVVRQFTRNGHQIPFLRLGVESSKRISDGISLTFAAMCKHHWRLQNLYKEIYSWNFQVGIDFDLPIKAL